MLQQVGCISTPILAGGMLQAWLSVLLFLWMTDLANVLGLFAQSPALSVPETVVSILVNPRAACRRGSAR